MNMHEPPVAFTIQLAPSQPGLSDGKLEKRKNEAEAIVRATMPFAASLRDSELVRGLATKDGYLLRTFSLVEHPQLSLDFLAHGGKRKQTLSPAHRIHCELEKLKGEAEAAIIRVGELEKLAASFSEIGTDQARSALDNLPERDLALWRLANSKRGKRISISFEGTRIGISMPIFPVYIADDRLRRIRFKLASINRKSAQIQSVQFLDNDEPGLEIVRKKLGTVAFIKRPPNRPNIDRDQWLSLYGAEYCNQPVEASVRVALSMADLSPNHLELVSIENLDELTTLRNRLLLGTGS